MARESVIRCNLCGKIFDEIDRNQGYSLYTLIGYGSRYDGFRLELDICMECMDMVIDRCILRPIRTDGENPAAQVND